ncbi:MAG: aconitase X [Acidimicrobiales bacterium]|jgi:hypothetical protein
MKLTAQDAEMLEGAHGAGTTLAMEVLVAIGRAFDVEQMCDITRAHVALSNQDADIWFAERLVAGGAVCKVPPTVNPGFCLEFFRHVPGLTPEDMSTMERTEAAYRTLGAQLTYNCTPYLQGNVPYFGEVTAYS